ncbi:MAG: hypothetical protein IPQ10_14065 [Saprospiraceae bacterium]|jgi:hypothetical protein|nr:hypothetical protein [Saprospiraceae bacterium]MBK7794964.1 hypothetical protein [Saprospiraceae bacterium]MBL0262147.1 hypothetical protein [Saprospiraceae bacterium]
MNKISYFFWACSSMVFNTCCYNCESPCGQSLEAYQINFIFTVFDKEKNESIIGHCLSCPYSDKVSTLVDIYGDTIRNDGTITAGGEMIFPLIIKGRDSVNYPIHQEYYLHLVDFDNVERDVDTISFDFTLVHSDRCEMYDYKDFRCYYNDSLYFTEYPWSSGWGIRFYK